MLEYMFWTLGDRWRKHQSIAVRSASWASWLPEVALDEQRVAVLYSPYAQ